MCLVIGGNSLSLNHRAANACTRLLLHSRWPIAEKQGSMFYDFKIFSAKTNGDFVSRCCLFVTKMIKTLFF
jgi:hypothetical protein